MPEPLPAHNRQTYLPGLSQLSMTHRSVALMQLVATPVTGYVVVTTQKIISLWMLRLNLAES